MSSVVNSAVNKSSLNSSISLQDVGQEIVRGVHSSPECKRRMTAAVVKFDPLANAIRPATQDEHFLVVRGLALTVPIVAGVHVGSHCLKLGSAGVHTFH